MTIEDLIRLCESRYANLSSQRTSAEQQGDVNRVQQLDVELAATTETLASLKGL
jgi:hypothetical protein